MIKILTLLPARGAQAGLLAILLLYAPASAQQIYKWKDEKGNWHQSDVPPGSQVSADGRFRVWKSPWNGMIRFQCLWPDGKVYGVMVDEIKDCPSKEKMAKYYADRIKKEKRQIERAKMKKDQEIAAEREEIKKLRALDTRRKSKAETIINTKCAREWPDDFAVRLYCVNQQREAVVKLDAPKPAGLPQKVYSQITKKCTREWPDDFAIRVYCQDQQIKAWRQLQLR